MRRQLGRLEVITPPASRNAPCPCDSGKRYKDCHGVIRAPGTTPAGETSLLDRARSAFAAGDLARAASLWRQVLAANPDDAEANFHIANSHREAGDPHTAISGYERALRAAPGNVAALNNLGLALEAVGERERAFECYRRVLATDPQQPDALGNLANALFDRASFKASADAYDRLFAIRRELPVPIVVRRGIALQKSHRLEEAEASFREAARRWPDDAQILWQLGSIRMEQDGYKDAVDPLTRAFELDPKSAHTLAMLAHAKARLCHWGGIDELFTILRGLPDRKLAGNPWPITPWPLLAMPLPPSTLLCTAAAWGRDYAPSHSVTRPDATPAPDGRLRVGLVSSDFREHPMASVITELLERLDRSRVETFGYGLGPADNSPIGVRIANAFEHFVDVSAESAVQTLERIRGDGIAILFDLNGYTRGSRPDLFGLRAAPVQINSIGYPGSLGVDWYDYIHVDPFVAPPWAQEQYSERFFLMPHSYYPGDTLRAPKEPPLARAACGVPDDVFVFCCFNNSFKILPNVFAIWMRLLVATPRSILWLLHANADAQLNLRAEAKHAGVSPDRLIFAPRATLDEYMARNACADLFLDTAPYGAHTTANDALLVGLPVLTCAGETFASRVAGSQLHAIGLPELVTSNLADYEALALALAAEPARLAALRARLGRNRHTHPLFDMAQYARDFEDGLARIWGEHAASPRGGKI